MAYSVTIGPLTILGPALRSHPLPCSCRDARKGCRPTYVFSISGQVRFRVALAHLSHCANRSCVRLYRYVIRGTDKKLRWLKQQDVVLGCPLATDHHHTAESLLAHLTSCPTDSCAQLRRAILLTVRELVAEMSTSKRARGAHMVQFAAR